MKRPLRISLTGIATVGAFFWMRSLASWRPTKVAMLPPNTSVYFLSRDAKTALLSKGTKLPTVLDVESGKQVDWPYQNSFAYPDFSPYTPNWTFTLKQTKQKSLEVRDFRTGRLERTFRWPKTQFRSQIVIDSNSNRVGIIEAGTFYQWDIATGRQLRQQQLDTYNMPGDLASYAISPEAKRLVACADNRCCTWDASSGKSSCMWEIDALGTPDFFSDDVRVAAYTSMSSIKGGPPIIFVDTATGKQKWTLPNPYGIGIYHSPGDEILQLTQTGCNVLDVNTGRSKRHLPSPRQGDRILRATPDWIYTLSNKKEILRWRAH